MLPSTSRLIGNDVGRDVDRMVCEKNTEVVRRLIALDKANKGIVRHEYVLHHRQPTEV